MAFEDVVGKLMQWSTGAEALAFQSRRFGAGAKPATTTLSTAP